MAQWSAESWIVWLVTTQIMVDACTCYRRSESSVLLKSVLVFSLFGTSLTVPINDRNSQVARTPCLYPDEFTRLSLVPRDYSFFNCMIVLACLLLLLAVFWFTSAFLSVLQKVINWIGYVLNFIRIYHEKCTVDRPPLKTTSQKIICMTRSKRRRTTYFRSVKKVTVFITTQSFRSVVQEIHCCTEQLWKSNLFVER
jgi:hypothetical protein